VSPSGPSPYGDHDPEPAHGDEVELRALAQQFSDLADQAFTRLPLYRRICEASAADLEVVALLLGAPSDQRVPNLLLASVHDVLLEGHEDVLADWYPSVLGRRGEPDRRARPVGHGDDDPWPHFRRLALDHPGVAERIATRATQTNEVGRSLALMPALFQAGLSATAGPPGGVRPLGIVEVGASAGLNLRFGSYGYRYHLPPDESGYGGTRTVVESIGAGSRLVLDAALRGPLVPPLPHGSLPVETAVGIDRHPLSVVRPVDARWLVACQWPEEIERVDRLRQAIAIAAEEPPVVEVGDAVADIGGHVLAVPGHALPVVMSSWVLAYLPVADQVAFVDELDRLGRIRDLALVFSEQPERVPGLPVPPRPDGQPDGRATALVLILWTAGDRIAIRLADQHPHGRWLEWLHG